MIHPADGQVELENLLPKEIDLQRADEQQCHQQQQKDQQGWPHARLAGKQVIRLAVMFLVSFAKEGGHQDADADAKGDGKHQAGNGNIHADDGAGIAEGEDVHRRGNEQEGDGRPQPGSFLINARKKRDDRAGTNRQQETRRSRGRVRDESRGVAPEVTRDGFLGDQRGHRSRDVKSRQEAQQHMRGQVSRQVAEPSAK